MKYWLVTGFLIALFGCGSSDEREVAVLGSSLFNDTSSDPAARPVCSRDAADHDGIWGFENDNPCLWPDNANSSGLTTDRVVVACTADAVDHGEGWGWENDQSCRWTSATNASTNPVPGATASAGTAATCSANALDTGDGWGWEFGTSCRWGSVRPASNQDSTFVPAPITLQAEGFINGKPICLTDASDGNSDGFGYENNQTCTVVDGRTATSDDPLLGRRWCEPWVEISYGDYVLQNNTWNDSEVYSNRWHQCIELGGSRGNYVAKWDYNWLDRTEGNEFSVKSYPQVYYGRKTRNTTSGTPEKLGLPAPLNNIPDYKIRFHYSETGTPERNVALESFFHTSCEAEEWNKQFELMVWVGVPFTKTPGPRVAEVTIDGVGWDVHTNPQLDWGYVAFVAQEPMSEGWLDWNAFVDWTRFNGPSFGVPRIQNNTCMGAIEIGTETFWGKGTFTLHEFRVTR